MLFYEYFKQGAILQTVLDISLFVENKRLQNAKRYSKKKVFMLKYYRGGGDLNTRLVQF